MTPVSMYLKTPIFLGTSAALLGVLGVLSENWVLLVKSRFSKENSVQITIVNVWYFLGFRRSFT